MKHVAILILMIAVSALPVIADSGKNSVKEIYPVAGTDDFQVAYMSRGGYRLVNANEDEVIALPKINEAQNVLYHDGMLIYNILVPDGPYGYSTVWGAIDLTGNTIIPFIHKKLKSLRKSDKFKNYSISTECRERMLNTVKVNEFIRLKKKLDEYRSARYSEVNPCYYRLEFYNNRYDIYDGSTFNTLQYVKQNNMMAVTDSHGNYITGFNKPGYAMYSKEYNTIAMTNPDGGIEVMRLDGYVVYRHPQFKRMDGYGSVYVGERNTEVNINGHGRTKSRLEELVTSMVNLNMDMWYKKDEFETRAEFVARTTPEMCRLAQEYYAGAATSLYNDLEMDRAFTLGDYDKENEAFLIESAVGNVAMKIPFEKSLNFRKAWEQNKVAIGSPGFGSTDEGVTLTSLVLRDEDGSYQANKTTPYTRYIMGSEEDVVSPVIAVVKNPNPIDEQSIEMAIGKQGKRIVTPSDVDLDIPAGNVLRSNSFALIIANENYDKLADVAFARHDGEVLAEYCIKTLGLPKSNVRTYYDATYGQMREAIRDIRSIADAYGGDIDLMVYYAGHGAPDERTARAFLLPTDAARVSAEYCLGRDEMLKEIAAMPTRSTVVLFDACFTGAERTEVAGKMLSEGRSVEIEPEELTIPKTGREHMTVICATSGRQTAIPDRENSHGLFTYCLLKKLRESNGDVTLGDLWNYLDQNVGRRSSVLGKVQRPSVEGPSGWKHGKLFDK